MATNPYSLQFGKIPKTYVERISAIDTVCEGFLNDDINCFIITGVRGSGKTVLLTEIKKRFEDEKDWIVVEINPQDDLRIGLAAKLYEVPELSASFAVEKLNFTKFGFGIEVKKVPPIFDIESGLDKMFKIIKKHKKKVLVAIDEVSSTENMKKFASTFQLLIREEYPLYFVGTGLPNNIFKLQNEENLTFLNRANKIELEPLNFTRIRDNYAKTFSFDNETAGRYASYVKGYSFAFQLMGYLLWTMKGSSEEDILNEFDYRLEDLVYGSIWKSLSSTDISICICMSLLCKELGTDKVKVGNLAEEMNITSGFLNVYKNRLMRSEVIKSAGYGYISFTLPRFDVFCRNKRDEMY